jgi:O-antigen/teichoic acid export membrane protein
LIVTRWINVNALSVQDAQGAVVLMGGVIAAHWPLSLYQGALIGLQHQLPLNVIRVAAAIASGGGALLVLWLVSPTLIAFFTWQMIVCLMEVLLLASCVWRKLPRASRPARFDLASVRGVMRFAGGMGGIALAGMVLTQMDKVILSGLVSLDTFGYYVLAGLVATSLHLFIGPVFAATLPRLCALVAEGDDHAVGKVYHEATQLTVVLVVPLALTIGFFAPAILQLWTGDALLAQRAAPIVVFLISGSAINGVMFMPCALQIAYGWTTVTLRSRSECVSPWCQRSISWRRTMVPSERPPFGWR